MRTLCAIGNFESVTKANKTAREIYAQTERRKTPIGDREVIRTKTKRSALLLNCLHENNTNISSKKTAKCILTSKENQFSTDQEAKFLTIYDTHQNTTLATSLQIETREGVTQTPLMNYDIPYKKMTKKAGF